MNIALASDHRGYDFKKRVIVMLAQMKHTVKDFGTSTSTESVDYPDYGLKAAKAVGSGECDRGILISGPGASMLLRDSPPDSIARPSSVHPESVEMSRRH